MLDQKQVPYKQLFGPDGPLLAYINIRRQTNFESRFNIRGQMVALGPSYLTQRVAQGAGI